MHVHTPGNSGPNITGTDLGDLLDDITGIHPGLDLIADGIRLIAHDRHTLNTTQVLIATLTGSPDATDTTGAIAHLTAWLTDPDTNPALRTLPFDQQKTATRHGQLTAHHLTDPDLRNTTAAACAALDQPRREVHPVTDAEREELSKKVADANKRSEERPR